MIQENLVLTSSSISKITINQFMEKLSYYNWDNLSLEINLMPRKNMEIVTTIKLDEFPDSISQFMKKLESPTESISIDGILNNTNIKLTALIDGNLIKWIEINFEAENKIALERILKDFSSFLKKSIS